MSFISLFKILLLREISIGGVGTIFWYDREKQTMEWKSR